jgi:hypothetical protein
VPIARDGHVNTVQPPATRRNRNHMNKSQRIAIVICAFATVLIFLVPPFGTHDANPYSDAPIHGLIFRPPAQLSLMDVDVATLGLEVLLVIEALVIALIALRAKATPGQKTCARIGLFVALALAANSMNSFRYDLNTSFLVTVLYIVSDWQILHWAGFWILAAVLSAGPIEKPSSDEDDGFTR